MLLNKEDTTCECIEASVLPVPRPQCNHRDQKKHGGTNKGGHNWCKQGEKGKLGDTICITLRDVYNQKGSNHCTAKPVHEPQTGQNRRESGGQVKQAFMHQAGLPWLETDEVIGESRLAEAG